MKLRLIALLLLTATLLTACATAPATTAAPTTQPTATPTQPTTAPTTVPTTSQPEEEPVDLFGSLFPVDGQIPKKRELVEIVEELYGPAARINEINYTWTQGRASMEVLSGRYDDYNDVTAPEESPLQLIYGESEFYNYVLYLPEGYDPADTEKKWPVIYFFHGISEMGSNLNELLPYGPLRYINGGGKIDAIVIAPQCPEDSHWADHDVEEEKLVQFVPEMSAKYNIDTDRMYLTGLSMGGRCSWKLALAMPDTFAAIAVVCGRTNTYDFSEIKNMPVWMFHGCLDETVPFYNVNAILTKLQEYEHRYYKLTVFPSGMHNIWNTVYERAEVYDWLLSQSLTNNQENAK